MPPGGACVSGVDGGIPLSLQNFPKALSVQPSYRKSVKAPTSAYNAHIEHFAHIGGKQYGFAGNGAIRGLWGLTDRAGV